jgi:hypothetical protein
VVVPVRSFDKAKAHTAINTKSSVLTVTKTIWKARKDMAGLKCQVKKFQVPRKGRKNPQGARGWCFGSVFFFF